MTQTGVRPRCLVTGASGFVGAWLVRRLVGEGYPTAVLARPSSDLWRIQPWLPKVTRICGELEEIARAAGAIQDFAPDVVFHLAWTGGNSRRYNDDPVQVYGNVPGSLQLLRMAAGSGAKVFVNMGSCVEYGTYSVPVRETDPVRPINLYGAAKHAVESLCVHLALPLGLRFASLRLFWAYGPADDDARLLPSVIRKLLNGERQAMTPGEQVWDYLYIEDVVDALLRVAETPGAQGIFNLGSGEPQRLRSVVELVASHMAEAMPLLGFGDMAYPAGQIMHLQAEIDRLKQATGWQPRTPLAEGLAQTVRWYKAGLRYLPPWQGAASKAEPHICI